MEIECRTCGQTFSRKPSQIAKYALSFCSRKCKAKWQRDNPIREARPIIRQCATCGETVERIPATNFPRVFCSRECAKVTLIPGGKAHPLWKGGVSPYAPEYNSHLREKVRVRDGRRCATCGDPGTRTHYGNRLEVHHKDGDKSNNQMSNLITLCVRCHKKVHRGELYLRSSAV